MGKWRRFQTKPVSQLSKGRLIPAFSYFTSQISLQSNEYGLSMLYFL